MNKITSTSFSLLNPHFEKINYPIVSFFFHAKSKNTHFKSDVCLNCYIVQKEILVWGNLFHLVFKKQEKKNLLVDNFLVQNSDRRKIFINFSV